MEVVIGAVLAIAIIQLTHVKNKRETIPYGIQEPNTGYPLNNVLENNNWEQYKSSRDEYVDVMNPAQHAHKFGTEGYLSGHTHKHAHIHAKHDAIHQHHQEGGMEAHHTNDFHSYYSDALPGSGYHTFIEHNLHKGQRGYIDPKEISHGPRLRPMNSWGHCSLFFPKTYRNNMYKVPFINA